MVEAGETEEPAGRNEVGTTSDEIIGHDNLVTVEDDTSDVTTEEDKHNTDDDDRKIDLLLDTGSVPAVRISKL